MTIDEMKADIGKKIFRVALRAGLRKVGAEKSLFSQTVDISVRHAVRPG